MAISITGYLDDAGSQTGIFAPGSSTDDTSPQLQGTLTSYNPGDIVLIARDGVMLGMATVSPGAGGNTTWSYQDSGLSNGQTYNYTALVLNLVTFTMASSNPCAITVDTGGGSQPPTQTPSMESVWDDKGAVTGLVANNGTTDDDTPTLKGTLSAALAAGQALHIFRDGTDVGTATMTGDKSWQFTDTGVANGTHGYTAKVVDQAGQAGPVSAAYTITVAPDATGPVTTSVTLQVWDDAAPVTGWVVDGDTTNDDTPTLQGTLSAALAAGEAVHIFRNGQDWGQASVTGTNWTFQDFGLITGNHYTYTAKVMSAAGSGPESEGVSFLFDPIRVTVALQIREILDDVAPVTGQIPNNGHTNDNAPLLKGSFASALNAGDHLVVVRDGSVELPVAAGNVNTAAKTWEYQDSGLADGEHSYAVRIVNAAGVTVLESDPWTINVDTVAPSAVATITAIETDTDFPGDFRTSDQTLLFKGTLNHTLTAGEQVQVSLDGTNWHDAVTTGTNWSWDNTANILNYGHYTIQARVIDQAGNFRSADVASQALVVFESRPPVGVTITAIEDDTGDSATDFLTRDQTLVFKGTLARALDTGAGEKVQVSLDGGTNWHDAAVTGTNWSWDNTANTLNQGDYTIQARVVDSNQQLGTASHDLTIDTTPWTAPRIDQVIDNQFGFFKISPDAATGPIKPGGLTDDLTPTFHGSGAEAGSIVRLYDETSSTVPIASVRADASGNWSYTVTLGDYYKDVLLVAKTYTATSVDAAGNESAHSASFSFTVDNGAPPRTAYITDVMDDAGPVTGKVPNTSLAVMKYVGTTDDTSPLLKGVIYAGNDPRDPAIQVPLRLDHGDILWISRLASDGIAGCKAERVTDVDATTGHWQYQDSGLHAGAIYTYTLWVISGAGVAGGESGRLTLTVEAPTPGPMPALGWLHGIGANSHDTGNGTAGNDYIGIVSNNFAGVNGGAGWDTLVFEQSGITLNLSSMGAKVQGFEQFDLNNQSNAGAAPTQNNTLTLSLADVLSLPNPASPSQHLTIMGDHMSTVNLADANWASSGTQTLGGVSYDVWHNTAQGSNVVADLLIQQGVCVLHI